MLALPLALQARAVLDAAFATNPLRMKLQIARAASVESETLPLRSFSFRPVAKEGRDLDYRLWVDAAFLESGSIEMAFEEMPEDEVGIDLYVPCVKLERSKAVPVYRNVRLETGRGGVWITPTFVIALYAGDELPGFTFLRLSERTGEWIKVEGEPHEVAAKLSFRLTGEPVRVIPKPDVLNRLWLKKR